MNIFSKITIELKNRMHSLWLEYKEIYPKVLDVDETIDIIIKHKLSVTRFGEGEFNLIFGSSNLKFQNKSSSLSEKLVETLVSSDERILICIPYFFSAKSRVALKKNASDFWKIFMQRRRSLIYKYICFDKVYGDACFTRNYIDKLDKSNSGEYFNKVKNIWSNREVLIIEGEFTRFGVGNDLLNNAKKVCRIIAPSINAFDKYQEIYNRVLLENREHLVLCALGPCATILSYDLTRQGYQAIDIGHLDVEYEWFLQNANEKTNIKNKHVNEVKNGLCIIKTIDDPLYLSQIISKVV